jgi:hypothetical protein
MLDTRKLFWSAGYSPPKSLNWNWCDTHYGGINIPQRSFIYVNDPSKNLDALDESCGEVDLTFYEDGDDSFSLTRTTCDRNLPFICQVILFIT